MTALALRDGSPDNSSADRSAGRRAVSSDIPARLDRLPWSRFHTLILFGLGITWILDGIEVTIVGAIAPVLRERATLGLSAAQIGNAASAYVIGAVIGAYLSCTCQQTGPTHAMLADALSVDRAITPAPSAAATKILGGDIVVPPALSCDLRKTSGMHPEPLHQCVTRRKVRRGTNGGHAR